MSGAHRSQPDLARLARAISGALGGPSEMDTGTGAMQGSALVIE